MKKMKKEALLFLTTLVCSLVLGQTKTLEARVAKHNNRPTIFINNEPVSPQFYSLTHAYGARWSWEENPSRNLKNFCSLGFRLFQVDIYFEDIWFKDQPQLDIAKAQRQVKGVLDVCPDAAVVVRIHINAPFWWNDENREERTEYADGPIDDRTYGPPLDNENGDVDRPLRASLASEKWKAAASEKLREFCRRLAATPEGSTVIGLHVSCGVYGEWHYWGFPEHDADTGPAMTHYFRGWLTKKYKNNKALQNAWHDSRYTLDNATVPGKVERDTTRDGIFRDPQKEQRVIDYYECQQYVVAEDILHFSKLVKETWPRPLIVGVFYNYFFMTFGRQASGGHLQEQMILTSPYIDYLSAPQSYWGDARQIGGSGQARGLIESARMHNKLWLDEMDQSSYKGGPFGQSFKTTREQDVPIIRRNLAQAITRGAGYWFYDFGPYRSSGWWDDPLLLEEIKKAFDLLDAYYRKPFRRPADVLFVYSNSTFYHIKNRTTPISSYNITDQQSAEAFKSGVLFDQVYMSDLNKADLKKYKAVVFSNVFHLTDAERILIREKVAKDGRHLVWNYMPGYTNGKENRLSFIADVTGMAVEKTGTKDSIYIVSQSSAYPLLQPEINRSVIDPLVKVVDKKAETLGVDNGTNHVLVAKKESRSHTSWYNSYMFRQPEVFREIFRLAGAHIYGTDNDIFHGDGNLLMVHTKSGGERKITLQNGKVITITMKRESTVYLDAETGMVTLQ